MFNGRMMALILASALAAVSLTGCGKKYLSEAEKKFLEPAKKGDAEAQFQLGRAYEHGAGANRNVDLARKYYELSAKQGNKKAQAALRRLNPPKAPDAEALKKIRADAAKGDAEALFQLGQCCEFGWDGGRDNDKALRYYARAAKKEHAAAKERVQTMTEEMAARISEADVKKYAADAGKGNAEAQFQLGRCYEFGIHVEINIDPDQRLARARNWYIKAAKQSHPEAMKVLKWKKPRKKPAANRNRNRNRR